jgi:hypothetical protein
MKPFIQARNITLVFSPKDREPVTAAKIFDFSLQREVNQELGIK